MSECGVREYVVGSDWVEAAPPLRNSARLKFESEAVAALTADELKVPEELELDDWLLAFRLRLPILAKLPLSASACQQLFAL